jgi:hypothetical protein
MGPRVFVRLLVLRTKAGLGKLFNLLGIPGLVRSCDYKAGVTNAQIKVQITDMYTILTVNRLDIYFNRLTGLIDGVGTTDLQAVSVPESIVSHAQLGNTHRTIHT